MFYTYESGGRVSRPVFDYRTEVLSGSFAARGLESFKFNQGPAIKLEDIDGTLAHYAGRSIYNTTSYRSGLGILNGAQTSVQDVPDGYVGHQGGPTYTWTTDELGGNLDPHSNRILVPAPSRFLVFNNAEESKSYSYHPAILDLYTEVDFGSITQNATITSNNGLVADLNATQVEYGRIIHVTDLESFGFSKTLNAASWKATSAWVGEGSLISFGRQTSPAVYGIIIDGKVKGLSGTADVDYSPATYGRGILPLQGNSIIGIGASLIGSGSFKKFTGASESFTINPDEKQMLFSFLGEAIQKNSECYIGDGSLNNFSNAVDERVFAWDGSGTIKIVSRKPFLYTLDEIADWVLEDIRSRPLSSIKYELSDEKHTENYNESAIVPWTRRDYGTLSVCTTEETINGDVSGNATGCIVKIDTTARVVSGQTYQVAASLNAPTSTIDWGDITTIASKQQNWGYIYDSSDLIPYGGLKIDPHNGCADKFLPSWTSRGYISKLSGVAQVPLDVGVRGTGGFRFLGASKTNFGLLQPGDGLFAILSTSTVKFGIGILGDGVFSTFSGASESLSFNPEEKQLLFSFVGSRISEKHTEVYVGSGRLRNFAKLEAEKGTFDYEGSGGLRLRSVKPKLTELSEEKHTESYNVSAFVPSIDLDYGLIIDPTLAQITTLNTQTISSDTTCPSGAARVGQNETVTLNANYSIPAQYTTPANTLDYGLVSDIHSPDEDYGWILGTHAHGIPYGMFDITGNAGSPRTRSFTSEGGLFKITGEAILPLFASVFGTGLFKPQGASITNFSLLAIGDGHINGMYDEASYSFKVEHKGDGSFSTFSGAAESATWNPEEKQLLFSFTSGYSSLKFTHGTFEGDGILYNFAGGDERATFDWVGTGDIHLKSAKPDVLTLRDLADYGLGIAHPYDLYFDPDYDQIGTVLLKNLGDEISEEIFAKAYNLTSEIPFQDLDYGLIVDPSTYTCVDTNGDVLASTTAPSGCIKVSTELSIAPGATYSVPNQITQPTFSEDYGFISDNADEPRDYDWILGTIAMGMRYTLVDIIGSAASKFQPNWVGRGGVTVLGASDTPRARDYVGSGTLFAIAGSANVFSKAEVGEGLFRITDSAHVAQSLGVIGDGRFSTFSGAAESLTFNPDEKQMLFSFIGTALPPLLTYHEYGSGVFKSLSGSYVTETESYVGSGTINLRSVKPKLTEPSEEKHTEVYDLNVCYDNPEIDNGFIIDPSLATCTSASGVISQNVTASTGCTIVDLGQTLSIDNGVTYTIPVLTTAPSLTEEYGFIVDPEDELRDYGWILGTLSKVCPFGSISTLRGSSGPAIRTFREVFTGESDVRVHGINIFGDAEIVVPPQWNGYGVIDVTSREISITGFSLRTFGKGNLWSMGGAAETVGFSPDTSQVLFKFVPGPFDRWTTYDWQPSWVSKGGFTIRTEEAKTHWVPHIIGTGNLPVISGAAESITFNPEERQMLFSFVGTRISEKHTEAFTGSGDVKVWTEAADFRFIPKYPGSGEIYTSGIAKTHYVPHVIGTGTFKKFSGAAESITFNPEEKQLLFSFVGTREAEKVSVAETGFGTLRLTGESTQLLGFAEQPFGTTSVFGEGRVVASLLHVGSGTFRKFGGGAESVTVNPEERQLLFSFTGELNEKTSVTEIGSGILFGFSGASETFTAAYETQGLYRISGDSLVTASLLHVGSGTLRKFGGGAESLTVNPDERQLLFSFTGEGSQSLTVAETKQIEIDITGKADPVLRTHAFHGSGTISVTGIAKTHWVPHVIGTGFIPVFAGAAESITVNPDEKQMLFSFMGELAERTLVREISKGGTIALAGTSGDPLLTFAEQPFVQTKISGKVRFTTHRSIYGTGSFRKFGGSAEAVAFSPEDRQVLFNFIGDATQRIAKDYVGSGTFRKLSGAAEAVSFNPEERQMLFSFAGAGTDSRTAREIGTGTLSTTGEAGVLIRFAHDGEGTVLVSGDSHTTRARDYVGFGFVPTFSGAAESTTFNPTERDMLFSVLGERISEKITARELSQGGTLVVGSTSGDPLLTFAEQPHIEVAISGDSYDIRTRAYQGSGRIKNFHSLDEAFALAPYIGSGRFSISGNALVQVQLFQPAFAQVWII